MPITDRRDEMELGELVEELHLAHPEKVANFERDHRDAMEAVEMDDLEACDEEDLDDLTDALKSLLRV